MISANYSNGLSVTNMKLVNPEKFRLLPSHSIYELKECDGWFLKMLIDDYGKEPITVKEAIEKERYSIHICP